MTIGYDKPLYVLPFDHRATFSKNMLGWQEPLTPEQTAEIAALKQVIYDGFKAAVAGGVPKDRAGILVDEEFGAAILHDARKQGFIAACPAEKSGQDEFDFEYGPNFASHIEQFNPTFCKVLVRYNPGCDKAMNRRQAARLRQLSDYLHTSGHLYMFELLVPPKPAQLKRLGNDKNAYDLQLRPPLMVQAIHELQDAGVEPDVWKIEGIDRKDDCQKVVTAVGRAGRDKVGCIILGRGEDDQKVRQWLTTAAGVPGFSGFAVGRTTFWDPLVNYRAQRITREAAVKQIGASYRAWVDLFEKAKKIGGTGSNACSAGGPTMTRVGHLWAIGYDDMQRADQVRVEVTRLGERHCLILLDSAVAVRYPDGSVTLNGEPFVCVPDFRGHTCASFLAGLALGAPPLTGPAVGALIRATGGMAAEVGIDEDFINEVQALMKPGTSALFVLDQEGDMAEILQGIRGLGGTVIKTNVDVQRARLIQSTLAAADNRAEGQS